ncbi:MAG: YwaF family protein [Clostridia bacterium]|nr:YwaF family protein [Clostridia bacterium]
MQWFQLLLWCTLAHYGAVSVHRQRITAATLTAGLLVSMSSQLYLLWLDDLLSLQTGLPLHLCGMMAVLCIPLCWVFFPTGYHLLLLLGVPGAGLALCFPAVSACSHPLLMKSAFLRLHALIIAVAVFLWAQRKPLPRSARRAFLLGNGFLLFVACINDLLDSNYLFLRAAPAHTPLAYLIRPGYGVYIASLEMLCILLMQFLLSVYRQLYLRK